MLRSFDGGLFARIARSISIFHSHTFNPDPIRLPKKPNLHQSLDFDGANLASVIESTRIEDFRAFSRISRYLQVIVPDVELLGITAIGEYSIFNTIGQEPEENPIFTSTRPACLMDHCGHWHR